MKVMLICIFLLSTLCSGCCSIMCGDEKTTNITSDPSEAKFEITDHDGNIVVRNVTPTNVTLKRGRGWFEKGDYKISFHKEGYEDLTVPINQELETGWYIGGNIVFGGLLGIVIIDPLTGAMWTIDDVDVSLKRLAEIQVDGHTKKIIGYRVDTSRKGPDEKFLTVPVYEDEKK